MYDWIEPTAIYLDRVHNYILILILIILMVGWSHLPYLLSGTECVVPCVILGHLGEVYLHPMVGILGVPWRKLGISAKPNFQCCFSTIEKRI